MYRIGDFSKLAKTTVKTLRFYDEIGLLVAKETDKFTGYRMYTTDQLFTLHRIQSCRQIGLSIEEVKVILSDGDNRHILEKRKQELLSSIDDSKSQLAHLEFILKESYCMNYNATIKKTEDCIVYSVKFVLANYEDYFKVIPAIGKKVTDKYPKLKCTVPEYCFIRYLDGEYKERNVNVELCEAIDKKMPDFDDVVFKKMESIEVVSVMHKGPYSKLSEAYAFAVKWVEENGYKITEALRERYLDGIWNKESEEEWLTEVQVPVAKI